MIDPGERGFMIRDPSRLEGAEDAFDHDDDDDAADCDDDDGPSSPKPERWFSRSDFGTLEWWLHT